MKPQWIDEQRKNKSMSAFADCLGNWRPDFLLTHNDTSVPGPGFQVCEINSRTPYNAIIHTAYKHGIMKELMGSNAAIEPAGDFDTMVNGMFDHFNLDLPIHLVRGRDSLERQEFALLAELKTGSQPRLVDVSDLQLKPDSSSSTGLALYCKRPGTGDKVEPERVHQVALALFPEEYNLLAPDMLRHLAKISVNDLRTGLFVNDQRFLGIILQELNDLVDRHQVLTPDQARILQEGIVPTILPGSPELKRILSKSKQGETLKNDFMLKAARASRGNGHRIGYELSAEEWEAALLGMQDPTIQTDITSYVLQPYVRQPTFDIVADKNRTVPNSHVVGTYYTVDGHFVGLGPWRAGNGKICNVYSGGCLLITSVTPPSQDFIIPTKNDSSVPSRPLQVCLSASQKKGMPVSALDASYEDRKRAEEAYYPVIFQYTGGPAHLPYELRYMTPHPLLISDRFLADLRLFHEALAIALTNIVQRWFTDKEAAFPTRMPLEPHEEDLLLVLLFLSRI